MPKQNNKLRSNRDFIAMMDGKVNHIGKEGLNLLLSRKIEHYSVTENLKKLQTKKSIDSHIQRLNNYSQLIKSKNLQAKIPKSRNKNQKTIDKAYSLESNSRISKQSDHQLSQVKLPLISRLSNESSHQIMSHRILPLTKTKSTASLPQNINPKPNQMRKIERQMAKNSFIIGSVAQQYLNLLNKFEVRLQDLSSKSNFLSQKLMNREKAKKNIQLSHREGKNNKSSSTKKRSLTTLKS